ncbi:MAG: ferredoxin family protein [Chloroflexi bacterium]|nr:ferredoxin family protein [Chloroflexota bacterium]MBI4197707.1 ferredoxin family protein [Chloroflexota bacterium]
MTYIIVEPCVDVKDKACVDVCPVDCIYGADVEEDRMLYINDTECIDCAACEPVCPVNAIFAEDDVPAQWKEWIPINKDYFRDADAIRAKVNQIKAPGTGVH